LHFNFSPEYTKKNIQEKEEGLKLNGISTLVLADDGNLLGKNINAIKKNTEALIGTSKEVSLEVNAEGTQYMLMSHHQNTEQNYA
jgi:hypothetical protein